MNAMADAYVADTGVFLRRFVDQDGFEHARGLQQKLVDGSGPRDLLQLPAPFDRHPDGNGVGSAARGVAFWCHGLTEECRHASPERSRFRVAAWSTSAGPA